MNFNKQLNQIQKSAGGFTWTKGRFPGERILTTSNGNAHLIIEIDPNYRTLNLSRGSTNKGVRGKGKGLFLRSIPVYAAIRSKNINTVTHESAFLNNAQKRQYNVPPSRRIVMYLGLVPTNNTKERLRVKNVTPELLNRLRRIVYSYPFDKKNYNRVVGKRVPVSYPLSHTKGDFVSRLRGSRRR